ncbi:MAG: glutamine synthetase III [Desulfobacterota bacterium]|nr:glutamine synthetase III [Thermodesulfobacteriota bacterium]
MSDTSDYSKCFAEDVFTIKTMRNYLSVKAYQSLTETINRRSSLNPDIADEVADAMKTWAVERGATHFTHWFQPLTGATAEKHDAFLAPDHEGGCILQFSGKELIKGEPDASSFPSGGLRATFEARGYTAWDPTSPAFIKRGTKSSTLCIPTVFCAYSGEALDEKTPLLRSVEALSKQVCRLAKLFGIDVEGKRAYTTLGPEQEYFLIDKKHYERRIDLMQTGRTLFGRQPAKHQQMEDHYFAPIKPRIMAFMEDLDRELWRLGIPAKTRHNEVCPAQFEIAPVFEELCIAVDHNMLTMEILRNVAEQHGLVCLLHEKPFAGVNGSGKHNNWSVVGPDGRNWLSPGENPHENAEFLTMICALMKAIDTHALLLRAAVASAGNDHRLGANEAPPAILSIFLGEQLTDVIEQIEKGRPKSSKNGGILKIGVSTLPPLPRDATDRNRTSPFAFTGNKFEFRAVGSSHNCSAANTVLNTIVADAIDNICTELESSLAAGTPFNDALQSILQKIVKKHKRILFNGDNYTEEWKKEAARRGLPNITSTPEALKAFISPEAIDLFERHGVLSRRELTSRYRASLENYHKTIVLEANCALSIAKTMIIPAAINYQDEIVRTLVGTTKVIKNIRCVETKQLLQRVATLTEATLKACRTLEASVKADKTEKILPAMQALRSAVDGLEELLPSDRWPLAAYADMMFVL